MESQKEDTETGPPDTLRIYGFTFDFPSNARLEFNPKFDRESGDVAVKFPGARAFVSWGPMARLPKKFLDPEDHAAYSVDRVKGSTRGKVTVLDHSVVQINGHPGVYNRVKAETQARRIIRGGFREEEARSVHLHCDKTGRFFVVFAALNEANYNRQAATFDMMVASIRCH